MFSSHSIVSVRSNQYCWVLHTVSSTKQAGGDSGKKPKLVSGDRMEKKTKPWEKPSSDLLWPNKRGYYDSRLILVSDSGLVSFRIFHLVPSAWRLMFRMLFWVSYPF